MKTNIVEDGSEGDVYHPDASICTISSSSRDSGAASHTSPLFDVHWLDPDRGGRLQGTDGALKQISMLALSWLQLEGRDGFLK